ncbi:unnamed protein product [Amoebophrya sp. A120]|nr:unnamed protein product [Amoebophrya sp. A120]|eukprot:GSA120T00004387001.1
MPHITKMKSCAVFALATVSSETQLLLLQASRIAAHEKQHLYRGGAVRVAKLRIDLSSGEPASRAGNNRPGGGQHLQQELLQQDRAVVVKNEQSSVEDVPEDQNDRAGGSTVLQVQLDMDKEKNKVGKKRDDDEEDDDDEDEEDDEEDGGGEYEEDGEGEYEEDGEGSSPLRQPSTATTTTPIAPAAPIGPPAPAGPAVARAPVAPVPFPAPALQPAPAAAPQSTLPWAQCHDPVNKCHESSRVNTAPCMLRGPLWNGCKCTTFVPSPEAVGPAEEAWNQCHTSVDLHEHDWDTVQPVGITAAAPPGAPTNYQPAPLAAPAAPSPVAAPVPQAAAPAVAPIAAPAPVPQGSGAWDWQTCHEKVNNCHDPNNVNTPECAIGGALWNGCQCNAFVTDLTARPEETWNKCHNAVDSNQNTWNPNQMIM